MMGQIDFSHEKELNLEILEGRLKRYYPDANFEMFRKAYHFAHKAHAHQKRSSGEPYIIHPLNVTATLIKLRMDLDSIISALLHDVIEDCDVTYEEIKTEFTPNIAEIVQGLTNITRMQFKSKELSQAENFRKMVIAMAKDIRVIIVKLADRLHNMKTLEYVSKTKQQLKAQETLDIYVPLAGRLGINALKGELEDLCLRYLKEEVYYRLKEKISMKRSERDDYIRQISQSIHDKLQEYSIEGDIKGRSKHFYSIFRKMQSRGVEFDQIHDLLAFRIVVENITECYKCLGIIHSAFTPVPGRFKDYIAMPKANNYQSLHTTVMGPGAERIEIQIRTQEMHETAEKGVAAHWAYKEGKSANLSQMEWVQRLLEYNDDISSSTEFFDTVKKDLDIGGVYVFTPTGDVKELSYGATTLDFAYAVHSEVGHRCIGAKVNGKMSQLKQRLKSGDCIEILTSKTQTPSKDWLKIVRSSRARSKIKQWLLKSERDDHQKLGQELLDKAFKIFGTSSKILVKNNEFHQAFNELHVKDLEELFIHVGSGKYPVNTVLHMIPSLQKQLQEVKKQEFQKIDTLYDKVKLRAKKSSKKDNAVIVDGAYDVLVRMGRCCNPIPGDPIIGYITRGRGITVHKADCTKKDSADLGREVLVEWNADFSFRHPVNLKVISNDRPGILSNISNKINGIGVNIRSAIARSLPDKKGSFIFEVEVKDYSELLKTISAVEALDDIISVIRT